MIPSTRSAHASNTNNNEYLHFFLMSAFSVEPSFATKIRPARPPGEVLLAVLRCMLGTILLA